MSAVKVEDISIRFGGVVALSDVSFEVATGSIHALIGPNGAGKTTLFNIVSGVYRCSHGSVLLNDKDVTGHAPHLLARKGLTRTFQNLQIFFHMTTIENVMVGCHIQERFNLLAELFGAPSVRRQNADSRKHAADLLSLVGLSGYTDRPASELPYGAQKRLEIARALAARPSVIMLDEPVAGCNPAETDEVGQVVRKVAATGVTVLLVEHDMNFVMGLADRVHVLDLGKTLAEGTASEIRSNPAVIKAYLGTSETSENACRQTWRESINVDG